MVFCAGSRGCAARAGIGGYYGEAPPPQAPPQAAAPRAPRREAFWGGRAPQAPPQAAAPRAPRREAFWGGRAPQAPPQAAASRAASAIIVGRPRRRTPRRKRLRRALPAGIILGR